MRALYLEPFSGLSGDMLNGLLLDLGGNLDLLKEELSKFTLEDYTIQVERTNKSSIFGMDFDVQIAHQHKDTGIKGDFDHHDHHEHSHHVHHHHHHESRGFWA